VLKAIGVRGVRIVRKAGRPHHHHGWRSLRLPET